MRILLDFASNRRRKEAELETLTLEVLKSSEIEGENLDAARIARAVADWALARSENTSQRFYSMSAQIRSERKAYYRVLEETQRGTLDVMPWMEWWTGNSMEPSAGAGGAGDPRKTAKYARIALFGAPPTR